MTMKGKMCFLIIFVCLFSKSILPQNSITSNQENILSDNTVVFTHADDPYSKLATEISFAENIPIYTHIKEISDHNPTYILWVVSPAFLSDKAIHDFLSQLHDNQIIYSLGIISGHTIEQARQLYHRKPETEPKIFSIINGRHAYDKADNYRIFNYSKFDTTTYEFTKENIIKTMANADYLNYAGGGGGNFWVEKRIPKLVSNEIPNLRSPVIFSGGCQTFRLWIKNSIALGFVEKGAAAYAGFVYSPIPYFLFSVPNGFPYRFTWRDFAIGHIVQIQNRGILAGCASYPWFILLGDPRKYVRNEKPYEVLQDTIMNEIRMIKIQYPHQDFVPIHIPNGQKYAFVKISGVGSKWNNDPFYNSRIQMVDIEADKYILYENKADHVTMHLYHSTPWYWPFCHIILSSLDYSYLHLSTTEGQSLFLFIIFIILIILARKAFRLRPSKYLYLTAALIGIAFMLLKGFYIWYRIDRTVIMSKEFNLGFFSLFQSALFIAVGYCYFQLAKTKMGKLLSILMATFQSWMPTVFWFLWIFIINSTSVNRLGFAIYNYSPVHLPLITLVIELIIVTTIFNIIPTKGNVINQSGLKRDPKFALD